MYRLNMTKVNVVHIPREPMGSLDGDSGKSCVWEKKEEAEVSSQVYDSRMPNFLEMESRKMKGTK